MRVANHPSIWSCIVTYLRSHNRQKVMFAARAIHVLMCYKDLRLLTRLHELLKTNNIVDCLVAAVARTEALKADAIAATGAPAAVDLVVTEMLLLALGSILGASAIFPWEIDGLTLAPLHATPSVFTPLANTSPMGPAGAARNATFLSPGKAPLPISPHPSANLHLQAIEREERALLQAQKRADLECGTTAVELQNDTRSPTAASSGAPTRAVLAIEQTMRRDCYAALSPYLQSIIENDDISNIGASVAALRVLQITLRDCVTAPTSSSSGASADATTVAAVATAKDIASQIHHYCFVTLLPEMNKVQVIIALDVLGLMTWNADFSIDEAVQIVTDLLQTQDSVVRCKALDTLVYSSLNPTSLASIASFSLGPLAHLLRYLQHLHEPTLDTLYILCSVLFILTRLVTDEEMCNILLKSAAFNCLLDILKLDDGVLHNQELLESHGRTLVPAAEHIISQDLNPKGTTGLPLIVTAQTIRHYIFACINAFAAHHSCRSILLAANVPHFLLQHLKQFGAKTGASGSAVSPLLVKGSVADTPDLETQGALHTLFLLAFKAHRSLKDALLAAPEACGSLLRIWAGPNASLSYKATVVLMRCGVSGESIKTGSDFAVGGDGRGASSATTEAAYKALSVPWNVLVETTQVYFLCDLIEESTPSGVSSPSQAGGDTAALVTFDEFTDTQVKILACDALHLIVRRANADPNSFTAVQEAVSELCKTEYFMPRLDLMCRLTPTARTLIADIRTLSNLNFEENPLELCKILTKQMNSRSIVQKFQGITMLADYCRKNDYDLSEIQATLPGALVVAAFPEVVRDCLIKSLQRARSNYVSALPEVVAMLVAVVTVHNAFSADAELRPLLGQVDDGADDTSVMSTDNRDDVGVQKTLGYAPDSKDYVLKSIFDALTALSGHENSAAVLTSSRTLVDMLLRTLALQVSIIHAKRAAMQESKADPRAGASTPSPFLEEDEVAECECELVVINSVLDVLLQLAQSADSDVTAQLLKPCTAASGEDETGLDMLLSLSVDAESAPILSYRPEAPRNIKFTLKNFLMRPIEPSLGEQVFFLLYHLSCGAALSTAERYIAHGSFMTDLGRHLRDDIDNWLSLVPHLLAEAKETHSASPVPSESNADGSDGPESALSSPSRTSDKPTQSMEAYVADILSAKLAMLTNLSRVATGRERIFAMQTELQSLLQVITMYVELPDVKMIYTSLALLQSLAPMVYQLPIKEKAVNAFVANTLSACFNAAARATDLSVIGKVHLTLLCVFLRHFLF
jgi:hypothetical protein